MTTLIEFLLDRIQEDEEMATSGWSQSPSQQPLRQTERWGRFDTGEAHLTPAAVLADCKAKRYVISAIEEYHDKVTDEWGYVTLIDDPPALMQMALPYAHHRNYDEDWRPRESR